MKSDKYSVQNFAFFILLFAFIPCVRCGFMVYFRVEDYLHVT